MNAIGAYIKDSEGNVISPVTSSETIYSEAGGGTHNI